MNKTTITAAMKRSFIVTVKLNTNVDALKRKIQDAERTLKEATGQRGRLRAELKTYLNTLDLTNEERKRIEGGVGEQTKKLNRFKNEKLELYLKQNRFVDSNVVCSKLQLR